jgi:hypothetical protein
MALVLLAGSLAGGAIVDRSDPAADRVRPAAFVPPQAPPETVLSSAWYCPGGSAIDKGIANGAVAIANTGTDELTGNVTLIASDPAVPPVAVPVTIGGSSRAVVTYTDHIQAEWVSALVELGGGGAVVEHTVSGSLGADVAPCTTKGSSRWYFADGGTTVDAREVLFLFNPFPEDAIVDLSFATDDGRVVPPGLQAVVVPGRGLVAVGVNDHVIRRRAIAASMVARTGRIVVDKVQTYDGSAGRRGLALTPGAASAGDTWQFPEGFIANGVVERYQLYNPATRDAVVTIELALEQGATEPIEVTVPAQGRATVRIGEEQGVPAGVPHAAVVRATNDVGIVVERSLDAVRPSERLGLASTMGSRVTARRWAFAAGLANDRVDEWVVLFNPGTRPAEVSFTALAGGQRLAIADLQAVVVEPGRRKGLRLGDFIRRDDLALVIDSTQPVIAERTLYRVRALGISAVIGIPLTD